MLRTYRFLGWNPYCFSESLVEKNRAAVCILFAAAACALGQSPEANRMIAPMTRAAQIELLRQQKAAELEPDKNSGIEHALNVIKEKKIIERITAGIAGFRVHMGGLITGSGFAVGPEYYRHDLMHNQVVVRASARASMQKFYLMDAELDLPRLADEHLFVNFYGIHRNYPH